MPQLAALFAVSKEKGVENGKGGRPVGCTGEPEVIVGHSFDLAL